MIKKLCTLFSVFGMPLIYAQTVTPNVYASDGGYSQNATNSISWTIGEPVVETYSNTQNFITTGFNQPLSLNLVDMIKEQTKEIELLVFPNPVKNQVNLNLSGLPPESYNIEIRDVLGKVLFQSSTNVTENSTSTNLQTQEYAEGNYFIRVYNQHFNQTVKILKVN